MIELDHIFVCVSPGAAEGDMLREFGLTEGSPNRHPGQGTANRRFFFRNAFLELLYLTDGDEAGNEATSGTRLYDRLAGSDDSASPFGVCLRPKHAGSDAKEPPFPSWRYRPGYLPEGLSIHVGVAPLTEPMWFFLNFADRPDSPKRRFREPVSHKSGFGEITGVRIFVPGGEAPSRPAACVVAHQCVTMEHGASHLLELEFDSGGNDATHDFRPALPLVFKW